MLIALFTALITILSGGQESPYVIPKVQKYVKQEIQDKDRKAEVLSVLKGYEKEWKKLEKARKKQAKALAKMNKDFNSNEDDMSALMEAARAKRLALKDKLVDSRLTIQELITDEEWEAIVAKGTETKPKQEKKLSKADAKAQLEQDKLLTSIAEEIESSFTDQDDREQANEYLTAFEENITTLLVASQDYPREARELLQNRTASRDDIEKVVTKEEGLRSEVHASFLELRKNLRSLSSENNWSKLSKALGKFIA